MSAQIRVVTGVSAGAVYWLEKRVLRIGGDPQAEVPLPSSNLAPFAATMEFREGAWRVYNRGAEAILLMGGSLPPGAARAWDGSGTLELSDGTRLALELDGDPAPCIRPAITRDPREQPGSAPDGSAERGFDWDEGALETKTARPSSSQSVMQLAVTALCVIGCVLLLMWNNSTTPSDAAAPTFSQIVDEALASKETSRSLIQRLQYAQAALVQGDPTTAKEWFGRLRDDLLREEDRITREKRTVEPRILLYVEQRLGELD